MDYSYATLRCTLKVYPRCDACKGHINEILSSIVGTYDLTMDAARQLTTIIGQVDPNYCMKAIARCNNGHPELVWANLSHPRMRERSYGYDYETSSYYDGIPYGSRRSLPMPMPMPGMYHDYPTPTLNLRGIPEYSYTNNNYNYYDDHHPIYYRRNPNYPLIDYTVPYHSDQDYSSSLCTIM